MKFQEEKLFLIHIPTEKARNKQKIVGNQTNKRIRHEKGTVWL
jgi:hypothetical protein